MKIRLFRTLTALAVAATLLGGVSLARAQGITQDQAQQILDELKAIRKDGVRKKIAEGLQSLRQGKAVDGEAVFARIDAELDKLEPGRGK